MAKNLLNTDFFDRNSHFLVNFRDFHKTTSQIPKAFYNVNEKTRKYIKSSKSHWIVKDRNHRGIKLYDITKAPSISSKAFVQKLVDSPYLIDDTKFDVAVYVSLRNSVFITTPEYFIYDEWLLRFCPEKYNLENVDGYVIHDKYKHPSKIKNLTIFDADVYNGKEALLDFLKRSDSEMFEKVQKNMHKIIHDVIQSHFWNIKEKTKKFGRDHGGKNIKFFEMVRFDFIFDSNKKVWLMEVNMSPNLDSGHFWQNAVLYRKVVDWALQKGVWDRCVEGGV